MGIYGNQMADQLARQGFSLPLIGAQHALSITAKGGRGVTMGLTSRKPMSIGSPFMDKGTVRAFLNAPPLKELRNYSTCAETS
jgi:hypothetical protein